jgi:hypothetical protein
MWFAIAYAVFWIGGNYSFDYTHKCVRSHTEDRVNNQGDEYTVTVCDFYVANGKRWTLLDPARAVATTWVTGWVDGAILAGIAAAIGTYVWYDRRRERALQEERRAYETWLRDQKDQ